MALIVLSAIGGAWIVERRYRAPRVPVAVLALLSLGILVVRADSGLGVSLRAFPPGLLLHIFLAILGCAALLIGCVAGMLFLWRSLALKTVPVDGAGDVPWPALTALDRLFVRSTGWGMAFLASGILLAASGLQGIPQSERWHPGRQWS